MNVSLSTARFLTVAFLVLAKIGGYVSAEPRQPKIAAACQDTPGWYDSDGPHYDCDWYAADPDGRCTDNYKNMGETSNTACCACGGGGVEDRVCCDVKGWYDAGGPHFDCDWYKQGASRCAQYGHGWKNMGHTANTACCECGGGRACDKPNNPPPPCQDVPHWHDADDPTYDCEWYSKNNNCFQHGHCCSNMGYTANEACCACGGGI